MCLGWLNEMDDLYRYLGFSEGYDLDINASDCGYDFTAQSYILHQIKIEVDDLMMHLLILFLLVLYYYQKV